MVKKDEERGNSPSPPPAQPFLNRSCLDNCLSFPSVVWSNCTRAGQLDSQSFFPSSPNSLLSWKYDWRWGMFFPLFVFNSHVLMSFWKLLFSFSSPPAGADIAMVFYLVLCGLCTLVTSFGDVLEAEQRVFKLTTHVCRSKSVSHGTSGCFA